MLSCMLSVCTVTVIVTKFKKGCSLLEFNSVMGSFLGGGRCCCCAREVKVGCASIIITVVMICSYFLPRKVGGTRPLIVCVYLKLCDFCVLRAVHDCFQVMGLGEACSGLGICGSIVLLLLAIYLALFFGGCNCVATLVLTPLLAFFLFEGGVSCVRFDGRVRVSGGRC